MTAKAIGNTSWVVSDPCRVKRSEAMPKVSLFGSSLEMQDEQTIKSVKEMDLGKVKAPKTPPVRGPGQRFVLPDDVKTQLPGTAVLERTRHELESQYNIAKDTYNCLKKKEERVLYALNHFDFDQASSQRDRHSVRQSQWFTEKDLQGSREINIVGLSARNSYNREKYGRKAPVHSYSIIGDIFRAGMDFPRRERTEIQMRNLGYGRGDTIGAISNRARTPTREHVIARMPDSSSSNFPPNIKNHFGSRECDNLLSDKSAVEKSLKNQEDLKESIQRKRHPSQVPAFTKDINPEYEMLSNALRMNVAPGYTMNHKISTTKETFNDQVHIFRQQDPDKWRYQKDELSKWRDATFTQTRLANGLDKLFENMPKFRRSSVSAPQLHTATVTNNRPATKLQKKLPTRRRTINISKIDKNENKMHEEFKFETPPVTPPSDKVKAIEHARDSEFWDLYDQKVK